MPQETKKAPVRPSDLLAAAAAIAAGTQAYGEVVIFINPEPGESGHFDWMYGPDDFPGTPAQWLDISSPSTDQGGGVGPSSVGQLRFFDFDNYGSSYFFNYATGGASVAANVVYIGGEGPYIDTLAFDVGQMIDGDLTFEPRSRHVHGFNNVPSISYFPSGVIKYMGVRFSDIDGNHYGWIGVVRNVSNLDAFAWGYETEPGVPIVAGIPAPGTLAALAFGAVVTRRGRKRKDD
jgi:hypothetical protein